jgi:O-antigen/teichoic acid export membrane protein
VPLVLLLPGIVAFAPVKVLAAYLAGAGLPRLFFRVSTSSLVVTVVLDLLLIPRLGIAGAALASSASYTTAAAVMLWIFRSTTGVPLRDVLLPTREDIRLGVHAITGRVSGSR